MTDIRDSIISLHKDRPEIMSIVQQAMDVLIHSNSSQHISLKLFIESILVLLEYCGDYDFQSKLVRGLLLKEEIISFKYWLSQVWFKGMPRTIAAFQSLRGYQVGSEEIRSFLNYYNSESDFSFLYSIRCHHVVWKNFTFLPPSKDTFWMDLNGGTQTIVVRVGHVPNELMMVDRPDSIMIQRSEILKAEFHMLFYPTGSGEAFLQEVLFKTTRGNLVVFIYNLDPSSLERFKEFLLFVAGVELTVVIPRNISPKSVHLSDQNSSERDGHLATQNPASVVTSSQDEACRIDDTEEHSGKGIDTEDISQESEQPIDVGSQDETFRSTLTDVDQQSMVCSGTEDVSNERDQRLVVEEPNVNTPDLLKNDRTCSTPLISEKNAIENINGTTNDICLARLKNLKGKRHVRKRSHSPFWYSSQASSLDDSTPTRRSSRISSMAKPCLGKGVAKSSEEKDDSKPAHEEDPLQIKKKINTPDTDFKTPNPIPKRGRKGKNTKRGRTFHAVASPNLSPSLKQDDVFKQSVLSTLGNPSVEAPPAPSIDAPMNYSSPVSQSNHEEISHSSEPILAVSHPDVKDTSAMLSVLSPNSSRNSAVAALHQNEHNKCIESVSKNMLGNIHSSHDTCDDKAGRANGCESTITNRTIKEEKLLIPHPQDWCGNQVNNQTIKEEKLLIPHPQDWCGNQVNNQTIKEEKLLIPHPQDWCGNQVNNDHSNESKRISQYVADEKLHSDQPQSLAPTSDERVTPNNLAVSEGMLIDKELDVVATHPLSLPDIISLSGDEEECSSHGTKPCRGLKSTTNSVNVRGQMPPAIPISYLSTEEDSNNNSNERFALEHKLLEETSVSSIKLNEVENEHKLLVETSVSPIVRDDIETDMELCYSPAGILESSSDISFGEAQSALLLPKKFSPTIVSEINPSLNSVSSGIPGHKTPLQPVGVPYVSDINRASKIRVVGTPSPLSNLHQLADVAIQNH